MTRHADNGISTPCEPPRQLPTFADMTAHLNMTTEGAEYVSSSEAAALMGVHRDTIRRWADKGLVPAVRTPTGHRRFLIADLQASMNRPT